MPRGCLAEHPVYRTVFKNIVARQQPAVIAVRQFHGFGYVFVNAAFFIEKMVDQSGETLLKVTDDLRRVVRGSAINDYDLNFIRSLPDDAFERLADKGAEVICRNAYGQPDRIHFTPGI